MNKRLKSLCIISPPLLYVVLFWSTSIFAQSVSRLPSPVFNVSTLSLDPATTKGLPPISLVASNPGINHSFVKDLPPVENGVNLEKLSPHIRTLETAITFEKVDLSFFQAFLNRSSVISQETLDQMPHIIAAENQRLTLSIGDMAPVSHLPPHSGSLWHIFHLESPLIDPDSKQFLGHLIRHVGVGFVKSSDSINRIEIISTEGEVLVGDLLLYVDQDSLPTFSNTAPPEKAVVGQIINLHNNLWETGKYFVVTVSKGALDGLKVGKKLDIHHFNDHQDPLVSYSFLKIKKISSPLSPIRPRNARFVDNALSTRFGSSIVFKTFEHVSFALVLQSQQPVSLNDFFSTP